ncbi:MAG: N-acetyltransferase [Anaerolineaceae bacterium]|nr:N-acetyltransferase [Anaerolineaceae bacterium]
MMIRNVISEDAAKITEIYNTYVLNSTISFEEKAVSELDILKRIQKVKEQGFPWIVSDHKEELIGYAYATKWRERLAYQRTVETTIYLQRNSFGKGFGKALYSRLLEILKDQEYHSAIGVIALPNPSSIHIHEKLGFSKAAHLREVGFKMGQWIDVGYWEKIL